MMRPLNPANRAKLMRRFAAIPERMKVAARTEVEREAREMVEEMKRGAPHDEGDLQDSIRARDVSGDYVASIRWRVSAGGPLTTRQVGARTYDRGVALGSGDTKGRKKKAGGRGVTYDYANAIEYGHMGADGMEKPAQPFFWPVKRRRTRRFKTRLMRALKKAIEEA